MIVQAIEQFWTKCLKTLWQGLGNPNSSKLSYACESETGQAQPFAIIQNSNQQEPSIQQSPGNTIFTIIVTHYPMIPAFPCHVARPTPRRESQDVGQPSGILRTSPLPFILSQVNIYPSQDGETYLKSPPMKVQCFILALKSLILCSSLLFVLSWAFMIPRSFSTVNSKRDFRPSSWEIFILFTKNFRKSLKPAGGHPCSRAWTVRILPSSSNLSASVFTKLGGTSVILRDDA